MSEQAVKPLLEIEDVKRLDVKPGDVLLVTVPERTTQKAADQIKERFANYLPGVKVIIKTTGVEAEVISQLPEPTLPDPGIPERAQKKADRVWKPADGYRECNDATCQEHRHGRHAHKIEGAAQ